MIVICREVDKNTGKIAVYPLEAEVSDQLLFRQRTAAFLLAAWKAERDTKGGGGHAKE